MSKYFHLALECYLIIGRDRSAVYNLDTGAIVALDEGQTRAMALSESKKPIIGLGHAKLLLYKGQPDYSKLPYIRFFNAKYTRK